MARLFSASNKSTFLYAKSCGDCAKLAVLLVPDMDAVVDTAEVFGLYVVEVLWSKE